MNANGLQDYQKPTPILIMSDGTTRIPVMKLLDITIDPHDTGDPVHFDELLAGITVRNGNMEYGTLVNGDFRIWTGYAEDSLRGYKILDQDGGYACFVGNNLDVANTYIVGTYDMEGEHIDGTYYDDLGVDPTFPQQIAKFVCVPLGTLPHALHELEFSWSIPNPPVEALNSIRFNNSGLPVVINGTTGELNQGNTMVGEYEGGAMDQTASSSQAITITSITIAE